MNEGKITYRFKTPIYPGNILYVNLIGQYACTNDCVFCTRPRTKKDIGKSNIYEKKAESFLYLSRSPSAKKVLSEIEENINKGDKEIAIIGLGEPLIYFDKVLQVIKSIKSKHKIKVRIDTNGQVECYHKNCASKLAKAGLDEIRISLNAINEEDYNKICRPKHRDAFKNLLKFIIECKKQRMVTKVSFVTGFKIYGISAKREKEYVLFANEIGIKKENIILRMFVK
ncbi:MAG: radical SAM protein [Candidatus Buchananbacteria bacterium]